jgi:hypothetical protein
MSGIGERCSCRRDDRVVLGQVGEVRGENWIVCGLVRDSGGFHGIWQTIMGTVSGQAGNR